MKLRNNIIKISSKVILEQMPFPLLSALCVFIFLMLSFVLIGTPEENMIYFIGGVAGVFFTYLMITNPILWVYFIILALPFFLISRDTELTASKLVPYIVIIPGLILWLINTTLVKREKIIYNAGDAVFLIFFVLVILNLGVAIINDVEIFKWVKEYFAIYLLFLYFPFRYYINTEKRYKIFLSLFFIAMIAVALFQLYIFRMAMSNAIYMYQVAGSLRINMTILGFTIIAGLIIYISEKKLIIRILAFTASFLSFGCILTSFARTMWIMDLALLVLTFFVLDLAHKIKYSKIIGIILILVSIIFFSIFSSNISVYWKLMEAKFTSSTLGTKDPSIVSRVLEYNAIWDKVEEQPLFGYGLGATYAHKDNLLGSATNRKSFSHNSYLQFLFQLGFPLAIFYFIFLLYYILDSLINIMKEKDFRKRIIYYFGAMGFFIVITSSFVSAQLSSKESILLMAISAFFIDYAKQLKPNLPLKD